MIKKQDTTEELTTILNHSVSRKVQAKEIADTIRAAGKFRWVGIYDVDEEQGVVSNIAWSGPGAPAYPVFSTTKGLTSKAIADRKAINVGEVSNDPAYLTAFGSTRSEIIIPIIVGDRVLGTIDVESELPQAFDESTQSFLEEAASLLGPFWLRRPEEVFDH